MADPTPAPWTIDRTRKHHRRPCIRHRGIVLAILPDNAAGIDPRFADDVRATDEANANLMAVAPDMREALAAVLDPDSITSGHPDIDRDEGEAGNIHLVLTRDEYDDVRAAIAKAEGGAE